IAADRALLLGLTIIPAVDESGPEFQIKKEIAAKELVDAAIESENAFAVIKASEEVSRKELEFLQAPAHLKPNTQQALEDAQTAREAAKRLGDRSRESHTPLSGARKAQKDRKNASSLEFPNSSTGRRSAFARWLTDPRNPLTARVAVNHIWGRHLGRPLV